MAQCLYRFRRECLVFMISILGLPDGLESEKRFQRPWLTLGVWLALFGHLMGAGDILTYSNSIITGFPDIVQAAVWFAGRPAVDFLLALFATIVQEFGRTSEKPAFSNNADNDGDEEQQLVTHPITTATTEKGWLWHPAIWYAALLSLLSIIGGWQINIHRGSFFQVAYPDYVPETVPVGCVIGPSLLNQQQQTEHDRWLNRSTSLANAGAKLIVWSEETGSASSPQEEADLLEKARNLALEKQVYLALTYDKDHETNILENKLVLVTPKGEIAINYNKAHPVPFVEPQPAGKEEIQYVDTPEFGRVGAAICFDYNFPWYIRQAST
ncbi:hypothetical protein BDB00DRAFT_872908 [Zychaea mexicana]|uniref:uncharacterized protein n=1 Tax=Zychaea mexicana TaxID=64656 RepID=UPI0022FDFB54|nr:uncharacterized protein BDB00DRAFT_872908 [Zychaea mexicana]KAI9492859.1 hypothetical protein BDB00DRAFT_872908 [Zychaea mexicana]